MTMRRISSSCTLLHKWSVVIPFIGLLIAYAHIRQHPFPEDPRFIACFLVFAVAMCAVHVAFSLKLADEVLDAGDRLRVRRRGVEVTIALADIERVWKRWWSNPDQIVLQLRSPGELGERIAFIPQTDLLGFGGKAVLTDLRRRVSEARTRLQPGRRR
ncbi:hypothetical protein [Lysobacter sp. CA199]|uniref:hypothetical protein n=1 Tax=Lysobacter sp. CA199 TaxID=3455608 RepID=UPI003F8D0D36